MYTKYQAGVRYEYKVRDYLENKGYYVVRSAGSHGCIDLVAIPTNKWLGQDRDCLFIQCKNNPKLKETQEKIEQLKLLAFTSLSHAYIAKPSKIRGRIEFESICGCKAFFTN